MDTEKMNEFASGVPEKLKEFRSHKTLDVPGKGTVKLVRFEGAVEPQLKGAGVGEPVYIDGELWIVRTVEVAMTLTHPPRLQPDVGFVVRPPTVEESLVVAPATDSNVGTWKGS